MNGNKKILNHIYQNAQMGIETLPQILEISQDENLKTELSHQLQEYNTILNATKSVLETVENISLMAKISSYIMIKMETLIDKSSSHISEMLIKGSTMGTIEAQRNINNFKNADKDIIQLAKRLLKFEEKNIENLKKFL